MRTCRWRANNARSKFALIDVELENTVSTIPAEGAEPARTVDPGGYELMVANEVFRSRFLHGFENPQLKVQIAGSGRFADIHVVICW